MDLGEVHNTFFDEYDTYVKAEQVSVDHSVAIQQEHNSSAKDLALRQASKR